MPAHPNEIPESKKIPLKKINSLPKVLEDTKLSPVLNDTRPDHGPISKSDSGNGSGSGIDYKTNGGAPADNVVNLSDLSRRSPTGASNQNGQLDFECDV